MSLELSFNNLVRRSRFHNYLVYLFGPFTLVHFACLGALWTGARPIDWVVCFLLYAVRMFGVTGGYHRYFSHRTYQTSRWFQFVLAFLAETSSQKGVLWWAAHHRIHHKESDLPTDVHSPFQHGIWYAHVGWLYDPEKDQTDFATVRDLKKFPELRFLDKYWWLPPAILGTTVWLCFGWSGLFVGYCLSTVLLWHGTFTINSLSHVFGTQPYDTGDYSRNNPLLALITMGEGWHNNHHYYQSSTRQGFRWWQFDITYYVLTVLSWTGLIWNLREPPQEVLEQGKTKQKKSKPLPV